MENITKDRPSKILIAILAAATAPAAMLFLIEVLISREPINLSDLFIVIIAFFVALAHAVVLGIPAFIVLRRKHYTQCWVSAIVGFIIGFMPTAILNIFLSMNAYSGYSSGGSAGMDVVNGVTTPLGWFHDILGACEAGTFGISGGIAFWLVWRYAK